MTGPVPLLPHAVRRRNRELWQACLRGQEPAESLSQRDREHLVAVLVSHSLSDLDIASHTRMTEYTTRRIRERLGLCRSPMRHAPLAAPGQDEQEAS